MLNACAGYIHIVQLEFLQAPQVREMPQAAIRYLGCAQIQCLQIPKRCEVSQAGVTDLGMWYLKPLDARHMGNQPHFAVRNLGFRIELLVIPSELETDSNGLLDIPLAAPSQPPRQLNAFHVERIVDPGIRGSRHLRLDVADFGQGRALTLDLTMQVGQPAHDRADTEKHRD